MSDNFTIQLPKFEGPFDLLLFFIERDELSIYDIPISTITNDFLTYLRKAEQQQIDLASEFMVVAATLMRIKAKMLLPRKTLDEQGNALDPRQELVQQLIDYKRFKETLTELRALEATRALREKRGYTLTELQNIGQKALIDVELQDLTLFRLLKVFQQVMRKYETAQKRTIHTIIKYDYTIQGQQAFIFSTLRQYEKPNFQIIFGNLENRIHAVITFLALLELLNMQHVQLIQGEGFNNFWVEILHNT
jgi:segregation and condensation protein A